MGILLILTGGTICSFGDERELNRELNMDRAKRVLVQNFRNSSSDYSDEEFHIIQPIDVLSENMTLKRWNGLLSSLKEIDYSEYEGVIVAHGTDTLAYTSSLLALTLSGIDIPVVVVSSHLPIVNDKANGNENFRCAVELIKQGLSKGVYVVYRNMDEKMYIHKGYYIEQCKDYSQDFYSYGSLLLNRKNNKYDIEPVKSWKKQNEKYAGLELSKVGELHNGVMLLEPYVGLNYNYVALDNGVKIIIHGLYHSQTACTNVEEEDERQNSIVYFAEQCMQQNIILFVTPCFVDESIYISAVDMKKSGVVPLYGMTKEMCYVKANIALALGLRERQDIIDFMNKDICGEIVCRKMS